MSNSIRNNWDLTLSGLLRCVVNVEFLERYADFIQPMYLFEGDTDNKAVALRKLFEIVKELYRVRRHKQVLGSVLSFEQEVKKLSDGEVLQEALALVDRLEKDEKIYKMASTKECENQFLEILKLLRIRQWTQEFGEPYKKGRMAEAQEAVNNLSASLKQLDPRQDEELDTEKIPEYLQVMSNNSGRNFRIGIPALDNGHGWIEKQTLNLFAAPPGGGKSMMVNTLIRLAIMQGKYVHVTIVENRVENFVARAAAALAGIPIDLLKHGYQNLSSEQQAHIKKAAGLLKKYVTVNFMYGQGIEAVHSSKIEAAKLRQLKGLPKYDVDIIDYTGHIVHYSGNPQDAMHTRFRNAYAMRKDFALKNDLICFDFVQINREGTKRNNMGGSARTGLSDLATSFDLSQVCDTLITINVGEYDRGNNEARLYIAKGREGGTGNEFIVRTSFSVGRYTMNYTSGDPDSIKKDCIAVEEGLGEEILGRQVAPETAPEEGSAKILPMTPKA